MAKDTNVLSNSIGLLDTLNPAVAISAGQGGPGTVQEVDDYAAATAAGLGTAGSYYRLVRFPTGAIIKSFVFGTDVTVDTSATASLAFDFNIAFSDSTIDGTPSNQQALIPTTALAGATTTFAAYSAANKMFGAAIVQPAANKPWAPTNYLLTGITSTWTIGLVTQQPLWQTFGFVAGGGQNQDPGGRFDMTAYVATVAGTAALGKLWCKVDYITP